MQQWKVWRRLIRPGGGTNERSQPRKPVSPDEVMQLPLDVLRTLPGTEVDRLLQDVHGAQYARLVLGYPGHARLSSEQLERLEREVLDIQRAEIDLLFPGDAYLTNFVINIWEWAHGREQLESRPWNITIPISDVCNARCTFCTSWIEGRRQLRLDQLELFKEPLKTAVYVGLVGHGEPLSHPQFGKICERLKDYMDPRTRTYTITNGIYLNRWKDVFDELSLGWISVSLNAATPETHSEVMGFEPSEFPRLIATLDDIIQGRFSAEPIPVNITMVVTKQNLHEVPQFIELGNALNAASIHLRSLLAVGHLPLGLNYHLLPPYLHPDFDRLQQAAREAIAQSRVPVFGDPGSWQTPVFPESLAEEIKKNPPPIISRAEAQRTKDFRHAADPFYEPSDRPRVGLRRTDGAFPDSLDDGSNPLGRREPFKCRAVYHGLYVNELFLRMTPCCYMTQTPGHDEVRLDEVAAFENGWNSEAFVDLRRSLRSGPLYGACRRCPERW